MLLRSAVTLSFAISLTACGTQVDGGYHGEPLASVKGTLTSSAATPPTSADVVLYWVADEGMGEGDYSVTERASVTGSFPASFELDVFAPPPARALIDVRQRPENRDLELNIGVAYVLAARSGAEVGGGEGPDFENVLGGAESNLLVYLDRDIPADSRIARMLHGVTTQGYHLMRTEPVDPEPHNACIEELNGRGLSEEEFELAEADCPPFFDQLYPVEEGTMINIHIVDDPEENLELPNWT